jgi:predicted nucleic acid-binding protein
MSLSFSTLERLKSTMSPLSLDLRKFSRPPLFLAAQAHAQYRKRGGNKLQVLPDFFIGAQAAVEGWPLLTRDGSRFRTYFSTPEVVAP